MDNYNLDINDEKEYLKEVINLIYKELDDAENKLQDKKKKLLEARKDMWENTSHSSNDFDKLIEANQHLTDVNNQTADYLHRKKKVEKYKSMISTPYFARFDFKEKNYQEREMIYVGKHNLTDSSDHSIYVYDWRAPISSIFYRYELGQVEYEAPVGVIEGEIFLKRQYNIVDSKLKYLFDCNVVIKDEILQEVLSKNSSPKMRNIVETIQKEQDLIIRNVESNVLIVQGVAGSGKSSIALHRIAYLMYEGLKSKLHSNSILILSPNAVFGKYISTILPELGEDNVKQNTIEEIFEKILGKELILESRNAQLERLINTETQKELQLYIDTIEFKGSRTFRTIIDRLINHYEHKIIKFEDIYYDGKIIENKNILKNQFLNNKIDLPIVKRLERIKSRILEKIKPYRIEKLKKIEDFISKIDKYDFKIKSVSRLLLMKDSKILKKVIKKIDKEQCKDIYQLLWTEPNLFYKLSKGLELPENIDDIFHNCLEVNNVKEFYFEDVSILSYLNLKVFGNEYFKKIRQVVIDESQDYYPIHYEIFNLLFKESKYTILGDINQAMEKDAQYSFYDEITKIFNKPKVVSLRLNKSYRASYEINSFTQKILNNNREFISFERYEKEPELIKANSQENIDKILIKNINDFKEEGFESIAIICKNRSKSKDLYKRIQKSLDIKLIINKDDEVDNGIMIMPGFLSKGLEFDVVLVYEADNNNYNTDFDKRLLYVSCTRALHRLTLYYTDNISNLVI